MLKESIDMLTQILQGEVAPATGCTEPVAVAYSTATAREQVGGELVSLEVWVDPGLYKNGLRVGIPGIRERGLDVAAALGITAGHKEKKLRVIDDIKEEDLQKAKELIQQGKVKIRVKDGLTRLYIETVLTTEQGKVRVLTIDKHLNIICIDQGDKYESFSPESYKTDEEAARPSIQSFDLEDILMYARKVPLKNIAFLEEGIKMNRAIAKEGSTIKKGLGQVFRKIIKTGSMENDVISYAQILCSQAAEARMGGSRLPVMSCAGSGNHGITVFLTNVAVAEKFGSSKEKLLRALALSALITAYIKSYTGTLSAMCGCGVAAGIGASAGVVYQLDGNIKDIFGAMLNMVGSISGLICDGGKEGCAYKLALASGWAIQAALLAVNGAVIHDDNGILAGDFKNLFANLGYVCKEGMIYTNKTILEVMQA